jgi:hypothetical protein
MIEDDEQCDSCDSKDVPLNDYPQGIGNSRRSRKLCFLCANTRAGNALEYPEQYRGQDGILQAICFVGNEILKALRK